MTDESAATRAALLRIVRQVRRRWRVKLALRGLALLLAVVAGALLTSAVGLQFFRFAPAAIVAFRLVDLALVAWLGWRLVAAVLVRRASDERVALYLEEHEPSLDAALVSAIEADRAEPASPLVRRLVESALDRCRAVDAGRGLERPQMRRYAAVAAVVLAAVLIVFGFGPPYLRHALSALVPLSWDVEAASPYSIEVRPGHATVPRGADQTVTARLVGFAAPQADLMVRSAPNAPFEPLPFVPTADAAVFEAILFDLKQPLEYFVRAGGVRSDTFTLSLLDLPAVERLDLEYRFPAYTGLPPRTVENGGDVAALRGTQVLVAVVPTMPTQGGRLVLGGSDGVPLVRRPDGTLAAGFAVARSGVYRVELQGPNGEAVAASPQYTIDVVEDQPPTVSIVKPGRDITATPVEEVFVEARAGDDFGVRDLQLVYSVNGGPERTAPLFGGGARPMSEVSGGHTLYFEDLGVKPGDSVSYYARASDNNRVSGSGRAVSDIYFARVRPFRRDYRAAASAAGGGGGGGGGGDNVGALSERQREIVAGTFNVVRDRPALGGAKYRENVVFLTIAQARLREEVEGLAGRMRARLGSEEAFRKIAALLPQAAAEMKTAETTLQAQKASEALAPEQRALQKLQEAEELYELEVSAQRGGGGGGGGANSAMAEDLADLFELELDKLANQYETQQRAQQESADRQIDEIAERLKELARRQQQELERQRRPAGQGGQAQGGSGAGQRALADRAQQEARRLEQLARDARRPDLAEAARRLQQAADAMRRAAATGDPNAAAEAGAALARLQDAARRLDGGRAANARRDVADALEKARALAEEQKRIAAEVGALGEAGAARQRQVERLSERKDGMRGELGALERQLQQAADALRGEESRDAARRLDEASGSIRSNRLPEKIQYSKGLMRAGAGEYARAFEQDIADNLDALASKIAEAAQAAAGPRRAGVADALERARQLARGVESSAEQLRERANAAQARPGESAGQQARGGQRGETAGDGRRGRGRAAGQGGESGPGQPSGGQQARGGQEPGRGGGGGGGGEGRGGDRSAEGGAGESRPSRLDEEDARQLRRQAREWVADAEALRRALAAEGVPVGDLDALIRDLRALDTDRVFSDVRGLADLQAAIVEGLQRFEFGVRQKLLAAKGEALLSATEQIPTEFRKQVEEYYKSLAKTVIR